MYDISEKDFDLRHRMQKTIGSESDGEDDGVDVLVKMGKATLTPSAGGDGANLPVLNIDDPVATALSVPLDQVFKTDSWLDLQCARIPNDCVLGTLSDLGMITATDRFLSAQIIDWLRQNPSRGMEEKDWMPIIENAFKEVKAIQNSKGFIRSDIVKMSGDLYPLLMNVSFQGAEPNKISELVHGLSIDDYYDRDFHHASLQPTFNPGGSFYRNTPYLREDGILEFREAYNPNDRFILCTWFWDQLKSNSAYCIQLLGDDINHLIICGKTNKKYGGEPLPLDTAFILDSQRIVDGMPQDWYGVDQISEYLKYLAGPNARCRILLQIDLSLVSKMTDLNIDDNAMLTGGQDESTESDSGGGAAGPVANAVSGYIQSRRDGMRGGSQKRRRKRKTYKSKKNRKRTNNKSKRNKSKRNKSKRNKNHYY